MLVWAMALALPAAASAVPSAAAPGWEALHKAQTHVYTTTTPTTPTTPTTTPTTPPQPQTTPTAPATAPAPTATTPYTQPTTVPYTPPATTQPRTTPAAPTTTPTPPPAPPPVVHKPKPAFHFDPPRVRLKDFGVAQRGAISPLPSSAVGDPTSSTSRARMVVLVAVGAGLLLALAAVVRLAVQQRRLAGIQPRRFGINGERFPAVRGSYRAYGNRMRVTPNERGMDMLVLGLALATVVALGALAAG